MSQPSTRPTLYKGYRFPRISHHCVWLYYRFGVSLRDVSELMPQRPEADGFVRDLNPSAVIITLTVMSAWGEALKSQTLSIGNTSVGPWIATITGVPAYKGLEKPCDSRST